MSEIEIHEIGDLVLIRICTGLNDRLFGSGWRIGKITDRGHDVLADEPILSLDDGGPPIYLAHIYSLSVLTPAGAISNDPR